jgi:hypothetical protein
MDTVYISTPDDRAASIREGLVLAGFSTFEAKNVKILEQPELSMGGHKIVKLSLMFETTRAIDVQLMSTAVDLYKIMGTLFGYDLQQSLSRILPCARYGDKILIPTKEYEDLRRLAYLNPTQSLPHPYKDERIGEWRRNE